MCKCRPTDIAVPLGPDGTFAEPIFCLKMAETEAGFPRTHYLRCGKLHFMKKDVQRRTQLCTEGNPSLCPAGTFWHEHRLKRKNFLCILICKWLFHTLEVKDFAFLLKYQHL